MTTISLTIGLFIIHYGLMKLLWGSHRYLDFRLTITEMFSATISRLGLPNGPQFLRLVATTPEQCPESVWLASLVILTSNFILLLCFLSGGMYQYAIIQSMNSQRREIQLSSQRKDVLPKLFFHENTSTTTSTKTNIYKQKSLADLSVKEPVSPRKLRQISSISNISDYANIDTEMNDVDDPGDDGDNSTIPETSSFIISSPSSNDNPSLKDRFSSKYSLSTVLVSYILSALMLDCLLSLLLPYQSLGTHPSSKSSCLYYEKRFHLIGYEKEYIDTVIIISLILCHFSWKYGTTTLTRVLGIGIALGTWILVWLTVDSAYIIVMIKLILSYISWQYLVPKNIQYFSLIVNDNEGREVVI